MTSLIFGYIHVFENMAMSESQPNNLHNLLNRQNRPWKRFSCLACNSCDKMLVWQIWSGIFRAFDTTYARSNAIGNSTAAVSVRRTRWTLGLTLLFKTTDKTSIRYLFPSTRRKCDTWGGTNVTYHRAGMNCYPRVRYT